MRDLYVDFILKALKTIYVKVGPDENQNIDLRLYHGQDPLSCPGAIRFDVLCDPKKLQDCKSWDYLQQVGRE